MPARVAADEAGDAGSPFLGVSQSATERSWRERLDPAGQARALAIAQSAALPDLVARVLAGRGVEPTDAAGFMAPSIRALLPDPDRLTDMATAADRIARAIVKGEKITLFADYDVDGATSAALFARFLGADGIAPEIYIPDRLFEGYGPSVEAMRRLAEAGTQLVIALDCGTTSLDALAAARSAGLDVVVVDHHQVGAALPAATALVNPNRDDDLSGLGHLAAVGVAFMVLVAVNRRLRVLGFYQAGRAEPELLQWLDLVALGTVCDVVPLTGINRAFVAKGLQLMAGRRNGGLAALGRVSRLDGPISTYHLGFLLGPRINAGGRIGNASLGARLLTSDDPAEVEALAAELDRLNSERQALEAVMLEEATAMAEAAVAGPGQPPILVVGSAGWHAGVVGLIAARLRERFDRPAFAIAFNPDGVGTGSGRSIGGVDLGRAVRDAVAAELADKGGGHAMAAGVTVRQDKLAAFAAYLEGALGEAVAASVGSRALMVDAMVSAGGATVELIERVEQAGPYGAGHPEPVFVLPAHRIGYVEPVGKAHVRATLTGPGGSLSAIAFRAADRPLGKALIDWRDRPVHIAGALSVDHWNGRRRPSLRVLDAALPADT